MTYDELIHAVAAENGMGAFDGRKGASQVEIEAKSLKKVDKVLRSAFAKIAAAARAGNNGPMLPHLGRVVNKPMRSTGRKPDGSVWTKPGRMKLALKASVDARDEGAAPTATQTAA